MLAVWNAPAETGKSCDVVVPVTYALLVAFTAIADPVVLSDPHRYEA